MILSVLKSDTEQIVLSCFKNEQNDMTLLVSQN